MKRKSIAKQVLAAIILSMAVSCQKNTSSLDASGKVPDNLQIQNADFTHSFTAATGLIFQSRFEAATAGNTNTTDVPRIVTTDPSTDTNPADNPQIDDLVGFTAGLTKSNWATDLQAYTTTAFSSLRINYEDGLSTDRSAAVISTPDGGPNKCLRFTIKNPAADAGYGDGSKKGRVAVDLNTISQDPYVPQETVKSGIKQYKQTVKFYIPTSWSALKTNTTLNGTDRDFLILFEFGTWQAFTGSNSNATKKPFRVRYDINTIGTSPNRQVVFRMIGEDLLSTGKWNKVWTETAINNTEFPLIGGNWYEAEIYIKEGTETGSPTEGKASLSLRQLTHNKTTGGWGYPSFTKVFEHLGRTTGAGINVSTSGGYTNFAPMKLYAYQTTVNAFQDSNPFQIYFTDLTIYTSNNLQTELTVD